MTVPMTPATMTRAASLAAVVPALRTARLVLRAPRREDFADYADIVCNDRGAFIGGPFTIDAAWDDYCRMTATWLLRGHGVWVAERDGMVLGFPLIGCEQGDEAHELGFLFNEAGEGAGFAFEAATAVRDYARDTLRLPDLLSYIDARNTRAQTLAERLGAAPSQTDGTDYIRYVHWEGGAP